ncbi:MAG: hypothetical protein WB684_08230, partial [Gaiella sp.]
MKALILDEDRQLELRDVPEPVAEAGQTVVDVRAAGVSLGVGPLRLAVLLGAGASMYSGWNLGTALGAGLGATPSSPRAYGIDLVAPLAFLAVLV